MFLRLVARYTCTLVVAQIYFPISLQANEEFRSNFLPYLNRFTKIINLLGNMEPLDFKHISWFIPFQISFVFVLLIMKYSL